ncbi:hypothetical protein ACLB2K_048218 [Fragaria x ananassa]
MVMTSDACMAAKLSGLCARFILEFVVRIRQDRRCVGRGWAIDFVGIIHPYSSEQHKFIIVATDFFTRWVEAEPLKVTSATSVRNFIFCNIISRFGYIDGFAAEASMFTINSDCFALKSIDLRIKASKTGSLMLPPKFWGVLQEHWRTLEARVDKRPPKPHAWTE